MGQRIIGAVFVVHEVLETFDDIVLALELLLTRRALGRSRTTNLTAGDLDQDAGEGNLTLSFDKRSDPARMRSPVRSINFFPTRSSRRGGGGGGAKSRRMDKPDGLRSKADTQTGELLLGDGIVHHLAHVPFGAVFLVGTTEGGG